MLSFDLAPPTHAHSAAPTPLFPTAVACPANTAGIDVPSGCTAYPGFSGTVTATTDAPYYAVDGTNGGNVVCGEDRLILGEGINSRCIACFNEEVCDAGSCRAGHEGATCGTCSAGYFWCVDSIMRHK